MPEPTTLTDDRIAECVRQAGIIPEMVEWYGDPGRRITVRIEASIGRYVECRLDPHMTDGDIVTALVVLSERFAAMFGGVS